LVDGFVSSDVVNDGSAADASGVSGDDDDVFGMSFVTFVVAAAVVGVFLLAVVATVVFRKRKRRLGAQFSISSRSRGSDAAAADVIGANADGGYVDAAVVQAGIDAIDEHLDGGGDVSDDAADEPSDQDDASRAANGDDVVIDIAGDAADDDAGVGDVVKIVDEKRLRIDVNGNDGDDLNPAGFRNLAFARGITINVDVDDSNGDGDGGGDGSGSAGACGHHRRSSTVEYAEPDDKAGDSPPPCYSPHAADGPKSYFGADAAVLNDAVVAVDDEARGSLAPPPPPKFAVSRSR
jgi:hypothetical protein